MLLLLFDDVQLGPCEGGRAGQRRGRDGGREEQRSEGLPDGEVGLERVGTGMAHSSMAPIRLKCLGHRDSDIPPCTPVRAQNRCSWEMFAE